MLQGNFALGTKKDASVRAGLDDGEASENARMDAALDAMLPNGDEPALADDSSEFLLDPFSELFNAEDMENLKQVQQVEEQQQQMLESVQQQQELEQQQLEEQPLEQPQPKLPQEQPLLEQQQPPLEQQQPPLEQLEEHQPQEHEEQFDGEQHPQQMFDAEQQQQRMPVEPIELEQQPLGDVYSQQEHLEDLPPEQHHMGDVHQERHLPNDIHLVQEPVSNLQQNEASGYGESPEQPTAKADVTDLAGRRPSDDSPVLSGDNTIHSDDLQSVVDSL
jgi:hypothetical protein